MVRTFQEATIILIQVSKKNRAWYARDSKFVGFMFEMTVEQRRTEEECNQDMVHILTQMDLLTKRVLGRGLEKVKAIDASNRYDKSEFDFEEKDKFLNNQGGFKTYNSGNQGRNMPVITAMTSLEIITKVITKARKFQERPN